MALAGFPTGTLIVLWLSQRNNNSRGVNVASAGGLLLGGHLRKRQESILLQAPSSVVVVVLFFFNLSQDAFMLVRMHSCLKGWEFSSLGMPIASTFPRFIHGTSQSAAYPLV